MVPRSSASPPGAVPPCDAARRAAPVALLAAACLLLTDVAQADVATYGLAEGPGASGSLTPTLGAARVLAPTSMDGTTRMVVSPDRRWLARAAGTRLILVPTDGGAPRRRWAPRLRPAARPAQAWWTGDTVTVGPLRDRDGTSALWRCDVAADRCRVRRTPGRLPVTALSDGRLVVTRQVAAPPVLAQDRAWDWHVRSEAWIRDVRRQLARRVPDELTAEAGGGRPRRTFWARRTSAAGGTYAFSELPAAAGSPSTGVTVDVVTFRLRTRVVRGRREARIDRGAGRPLAAWALDDGRLRAAVPAGVQRLAVLRLLLPDGRTVVQRYPPPRTDAFAPRLALVDPAGRVDTLRVAGRALTPSRLRVALGLPRGDRLPAPRPAFGEFHEPPVEPLDYEASTTSLVVAVPVRGAEVVARVPLDGRAPSVVSRGEFAPLWTAAW